MNCVHSSLCITVVALVGMAGCSGQPETKMHTAAASSTSTSKEKTKPVEESATTSAKTSAAAQSTTAPPAPSLKSASELKVPEGLSSPLAVVPMAKISWTTYANTKPGAFVEYELAGG